MIRLEMPPERSKTNTDRMTHPELTNASNRRIGAAMGINLINRRWQNPDYILLDIE